MLFLLCHVPSVPESSLSRCEYTVTLRELEVLEQRLLWRSGEAAVWLTDTLPAGTAPFPPPHAARETHGSYAAGNEPSGRSRSTVAGFSLPWLLCAPAAPSGILPELFSPFEWSGRSLPFSDSPPVRPLTGWQRPGKRYGLALSLPAGTLGAAYLTSETALSTSTPHPVPSTALAFLRIPAPRSGYPWAFLGLSRSLPGSPLSEAGYEDDPYYLETPEFLGGPVYHAVLGAAAGHELSGGSRVPVSFELGTFGAGSAGARTAPGWLVEGYGRLGIGSVEKLTVTAGAASDRFVTPEGEYPETVLELSVLNELSFAGTVGFIQRYGRRVKRFFPVPGANRETEERIGGALSYSSRLGHTGTLRTALECLHETGWEVDGAVESRTSLTLTAGLKNPASKPGLTKVNFSLKGARELGLEPSGLPEPASRTFRASFGTSFLLHRRPGPAGPELSLAAAAAFSYTGKPRWEAAFTLEYSRAGSGGFLKVFTKKPVPWNTGGEGAGPPPAIFPEYVTVSIGWKTMVQPGRAGAGKEPGATAHGTDQPSANESRGGESGLEDAETRSEIEQELGDLEIHR